MTKKEFKRAMICGLGRCIQALYTEEDIEKYRDIILWGCTHEIFYDAQCEGTKSWYLYTMVKRYPDVVPFIEATIVCAKQQMKRNTWLFCQCCEFLGFFGADGYKRAQYALYDIYEELYRILMHKRRRTKYGLSPENENFEQLCIVLVNMEATKEACLDAYCKIVEKIGILMMNSHLIDAWGFAWFQSYWEDELGKNVCNMLKKQAKSSEGIRYYLEAMQKKQEDMEVWKGKRKMPRTAKDIYDSLANGGRVGRDFPILAVRMLVKDGQEQEVKKLAEYHKKEKDIEIRKQLTWLLAWGQSAHLLDVDILITDSQSKNALLRQYAFQALSYIRHKKVREYAFELLGDVDETENILKKAVQLEDFTSVFAMLICNYEKKDAGWFVAAVKAIPVSRRETIGWHSIYMTLQNAFQNKKIPTPPKEILYHIYEYGQCACCRESVVREMSRRRMLTRELLQECLHDSNSEVREFAEKKTLISLQSDKL